MTLPQLAVLQSLLRKLHLQSLSTLAQLAVVQRLLRTRHLQSLRTLPQLAVQPQPLTFVTATRSTTS